MNRILPAWIAGMKGGALVLSLCMTIAFMALPPVGHAANTCTSTTSTSAGFLTVAESHNGYFDRGSSGSTFTVTVTNGSGQNTAPSPYTDLCAVSRTLGTQIVTVAVTPPLGLTPTDMTGTGWACVLGSLTCTRTDGLPVGGSYPPITLTVDVASDAPLTMTNTATLTGSFLSHNVMGIYIGDFLLGYNDVINTDTWNPGNAYDTACIEHIVRVGSSDYFDTLAAAYGSLGASATAEFYLHDATYAALSFDKDAVVGLNGGRDCAFGSIDGFSSIEGQLTITDGTITADRIIIL